MKNITHVKTCDKKHVFVNFDNNYLVVNIRSNDVSEADALLNHTQVENLHKALGDYLDHRKKLIENFGG